MRKRINLAPICGQTWGTALGVKSYRNYTESEHPRELRQGTITRGINNRSGPKGVYRRPRGGGGSVPHAGMMTCWWKWSSWPVP